MNSLALKVVIGVGVLALLAALALMVWGGFAMSAHGG
jgi:hypothetical protein